MRLRAIVCLLAGGMVGGCYRYVPAGPEPQPGRVIKAELNEAGASALTSKLGPGVTALDGLLLAREGDQLSILVESYITQRQGLLTGGNEALSVSLTHISTLQEKRPDKLRSVALGALLLGGAIAAFQIFGPEERLFEDEEEEDPGPPSIRRRGFKILSVPLNAVFGGARVP